MSSSTGAQRLAFVPVRVASSKDPTIPKPPMVNGASIAGAFITRAVDVQGLGRADTNHRYTTDRAVRARMVAKGWVAEGDGADLVVMCAAW